MDKRLVRQKAFKFLGNFDESIDTKLKNICGKTGQYDVPSELFQKRTKRSNRALISWSAVQNNNLTIRELSNFEGGVVVEFINNDFFDEQNKNDATFIQLLNRIGSNENVSAIISIRSEGGSSSSAIQREAFNKLINNSVVNYKGKSITINENNYEDYAIKQLIRGKGTGNETWDGFLFVSIRGGQQDTIETHRGQELTLFNPACEYAGTEVILDIDLVVSYYMLKSIDYDTLGSNKLAYNSILNNVQECLSESEYDSEAYKGNLLDCCDNQYCLSLIKNQLTDPIQLKRITIDNFTNKVRNDESVDFTHNEAVVWNKYYWDRKKNCILSPARPSNIFWSLHLSNMMQQNFTLDEYFKYEEERFNKRKNLIENNSK